MPKGTRRRRDVSLHCTVPADLAAWLRARAAAHDESESAALTRILDAALAEDARVPKGETKMPDRNPETDPEDAPGHPSHTAPSDARLGLYALCLDGLGPVPAPWPEFDPLTAVTIEARARAVVDARDGRARAAALHDLARPIRAIGSAGASTRTSGDRK